MCPLRGHANIVSSQNAWGHANIVSSQNAWGHANIVSSQNAWGHANIVSSQIARQRGAGAVRRRHLCLVGARGLEREVVGWVCERRRFRGMKRFQAGPALLLRIRSTPSRCNHKATQKNDKQNTPWIIVEGRQVTWSKSIILKSYLKKVSKRRHSLSTSIFTKECNTIPTEGWGFFWGKRDSYQFSRSLLKDERNYRHGSG